MNKAARVAYLEGVIFCLVAGTRWVFGVVWYVRQRGTTAVNKNVLPPRVTMVITENLQSPNKTLYIITHLALL